MKIFRLDADFHTDISAAATKHSFLALVTRLFDRLSVFREFILLLGVGDFETKRELTHPPANALFFDSKIFMVIFDLCC